ncbi:hypothetical protein D3C71_1749360 [compost metagenome]
MGVCTMPGATQLTRMPWAPWCAAMARVMLTTAPFDVGYSRLGWPPIRPATEATLTIAPLPMACMCGMEWRAISIMDVTFTRSAWSQASRSRSTAVPCGPPMPTLFTRMSTRPH